MLTSVEVCPGVQIPDEHAPAELRGESSVLGVGDNQVGANTVTNGPCILGRVFKPKEREVGDSNRLANRLCGKYGLAAPTRALPWGIVA